MFSLAQHYKQKTLVVWYVISTLYKTLGCMLQEV
jgi:hypothetical protein